MDKVIEFPKHKVVREVPDTIKEERNQRAQQKMADTIVDEITGLIITELDNYYVEIESKTFTKDFILVADSLKATVYRHFGLEHHLHDFIDKNVTVIEGEFDSLSSDEIKTKIESVMKELEEEIGRAHV